MAVDDRLRQAGRAGGEEHAQRVRERHLVELERPLLGEQARSRSASGQRVAGPAGVADVDDARRRSAAARGSRRPAPRRSTSLSPQRYPATASSTRRLELAEPVEHAARPELRRAGRPDRAEARGGEEGDERLRDVRQVRDDAVARADAEALQAGARRARPARAARANVSSNGSPRLRDRRPRRPRRVLLAAEHVLGVVQPRAREPLGAGHAVGGEHPLVRRRPGGPRRSPRSRPRSLRGRRPTSGAARRSRRTSRPRSRSQPGEEPAGDRALAHVRGRLPEDLSKLRNGGHVARSWVRIACKRLGSPHARRRVPRHPHDRGRGRTRAGCGPVRPRPRGAGVRDLRLRLAYISRRSARRAGPGARTRVRRRGGRGRRGGAWNRGRRPRSRASRSSRAATAGAATKGSAISACACTRPASASASRARSPTGCGSRTRRSA